MQNQYKIQTPKLRKPKIKICGISDKLSDDEILDFLIKQNECIKAEDDLKVIKTLEEKKQKK